MHYSAIEFNSTLVLFLAGLGTREVISLRFGALSGLPTRVSIVVKPYVLKEASTRCKRRVH